MGSCERAEKDQDYQILGASTKTKETATVEKMKRLISPSPETTQPRGTPTVATNSTQGKRKASSTASATQYLNQYIQKPVKELIV